jgi:hypothetical protein
VIGPLKGRHLDHSRVGCCHLVLVMHCEWHLQVRALGGQWWVRVYGECVW